MSGASKTVTCPHCGAENTRSPIVTICYRCFKSLDSAPQPMPAAPMPAAPVPVPPPPPPAAVRPRALPPPPEPELGPAAPPPMPSAPPVTVPTPLGAPVTAEAVGRALRRAVPALPGTEEARPVLIVLPIVVLGVMLAASEGRALPVVLVIAGVLGAVVALRTWLALSYGDAVPDPVPTAARLGQDITWGVTLRANRPMTIGPSTITLKCEERTVKGAGKSARYFRNTLHEETATFPLEVLAPGQVAELHTRFTVPPTATPTFRATSNRVEWTLSVHAPITGACPTISERAVLSVVPIREGAASEAAEPKPSEPAAARGGPVWVALSAADRGQPHEAPIVEAGRSRDLTLAVGSVEGVRCRGLHCRTGYRLFGSGNEEWKWIGEESVIHQGELAPGATITAPVTVSIPAGGPVTFSGQHVNCEWVVRVRLDMPLRRDVRVDVPLRVIPRLAPTS
jgi:hypothetical protein